MRVIMGNLLTVNQDEYPGLGDWWIQLRDEENSDIVIARVYGDTGEEVLERAKEIVKRINGAGRCVT